jgi:radical SAM-linked protein
LGFTSQHELVDVWLDERFPVEEVFSRLTRAVPPGLQIHACREAKPDEASLPSQVTASEYLITFLDRTPDLEREVDTLMSAESLPRTLRSKAYDLRPLILDIKILRSDESGCQRILAKLVAQEGATGRPDEIVSALGESPSRTLIHRTQLIFKANK